MSARLRGIAKETEKIVEAGSYRSPQGREVSIADALEAALTGVRMYGPDPVPAAERADARTEFEVTGESSIEAAARMTGERPGAVAILNFASARNPGGGYLNGAQAQEEALCRSSALYTTLLRAPEFYAHHRADRSPFYTDRVIHSPQVPVFRDDRGALLPEPFSVGFLTSPAPNAGVIRARSPEDAHRIPHALAVRAERVLETAVACGYRRLVLGAWGCGVFRNEPARVAGAFHAHLTGAGRFGGHFEQVVFAVLDRDPASATRAAFADAFAGQSQP
ncbi:TIGR02452 family protein [Streptomyces sp. NBC_01465]|uniref:TIGR02452 family protein n=1 Tax=Streptomyces sp. NBC_01465 TaxID=2903878 RepID=UPI002E34824A|nr:TIGR02452 family protein [Streptomyces sp. NBC_01465]